jgi:hypothetical protein
MPRRMYLKQIVRVDVARTDLPMPIGGGRWGWLRQQAFRIQLTPAGRAFLEGADIVLAVDEQGTQQGIAYGEDRLRRIVETGQSETVRVVSVVLDGSAKKIGRGDTDLELLAAACLVAKGEGLDEEPE